MNISKAARRALIPIERKIMNERVECGYFLRNEDGKELLHLRGHESGIHLGKHHKWHKLLLFSNNKIFTHNHPDETKRFLFLSPNDLIVGIFQNCREVRAVSEDGFCHLAEIPKMGLIKKIKCLYNLADYLIFRSVPIKHRRFREAYRKLQKKISKDWGIKFRMIKLPESP